jgi:branched-subunit amino acid aminotransferase/4-amino-4-deoxychorismate lyase
MLSIEWTASEGWLNPRITPYQNLSLDPATCVFHYAFTCFEGMKAYKDSKGQIRLFRPDKNMQRLNKSSARIALPTFDGDALVELIGKLVKMDERFIPRYLHKPHSSPEQEKLTHIMQRPRLLPLPPPHNNRHPTHPRRRSPGFCATLRNRIPRRPLLPDWLQSRLTRSHRLRRARLAWRCW